jgi:hypothetical protein
MRNRCRKPEESLMVRFQRKWARDGHTPNRTSQARNPPSGKSASVSSVGRHGRTWRRSSGSLESLSMDKALLTLVSEFLEPWILECTRESRAEQQPGPS